MELNLWGQTATNTSCRSVSAKLSDASGGSTSLLSPVRVFSHYPQLMRLIYLCPVHWEPSQYILHRSPLYHTLPNPKQTCPCRILFWLYFPKLDTLLSRLPSVISGNYTGGTWSLLPNCVEWSCRHDTVDSPLGKDARFSSNLKGRIWLPHSTGDSRVE